MTTDSTQDIGVSSWLSTLPSQFPSEVNSAIEAEESHSKPPSQPTPTCQSRKRKADVLDNAFPPPKLPCSELTRRALRELEASMASKPRTPNGKKASQTGMQTPKTSENESGEFNITRVSIPQSVGNVRTALDNAGMRYDDEDAWSRYPEFQRTIESILDIPRGSSIGDESSRKAKRLIKQTRFAGEATFLKKVFPVIVPTTHTVNTNKRGVSGEMVTARRDYEDNDNLAVTEQPRFAKGFVPGKAFRQKAKEFGLTDPVPDQVYGKKQPLHTKGSDAHLPPWLVCCKSINTKTEWPHMCLEAKTDSTIAEAENQAIRDCAAIVNSRLRLKWYAEGQGYEQPLGADPEIFVFSISFGPDFTRIAVHWFEKLEDGESYFHMTPVGQYFVNEKSGQATMRSRIHNIWDYGLVKYHYNAEQTYRKAVAKWRKDGNTSESAALAEAAAEATNPSSNTEAVA